MWLAARSNAPVHRAFRAAFCWLRSVVVYVVLAALDFESWFRQLCQFVYCKAALDFESWLRRLGQFVYLWSCILEPDRRGRSHYRCASPSAALGMFQPNGPSCVWFAARK